MLAQSSEKHHIQDCVLRHQKGCGESVCLPFYPIADFLVGITCATVVTCKPVRGVVGIRKCLVKNLVGDFMGQSVIFTADQFL